MKIYLKSSMDINKLQTVEKQIVERIKSMFSTNFEKDINEGLKRELVLGDPKIYSHRDYDCVLEWKTDPSDMEENGYSSVTVNLGGRYGSAESKLSVLIMIDNHRNFIQARIQVNLIQIPENDVQWAIDELYDKSLSKFEKYVFDYLT